jgi:transporter family protein
MSWIAPALAYIVLVGVLGVTSKYALRALEWQEVIVWSAVAYALVAALLVVTGTPVRAHGGFNGGMALVTALIAPVSLGMLYLALGSGPASRVIPMTSAYPLVTVVLALLILHEQLTATRLLGVALVVAGVALLTA